MILYSRYTFIIALTFLLGLTSGISTVFASATVEIIVANGNEPLPMESISIYSEDGQAVEENIRNHKNSQWTWKGLKPGNYTVRSGDQVLRKIQVSQMDTIKKIIVNPTLSANGFSGTPNFFNNFNNYNAPIPTETIIRLGLRGNFTFDRPLADVYSSAFSNSPIMGNIGQNYLGVGLDVDIQPEDLPVYFRLGFAWNPDGSDSGAGGDKHPPGNQQDTFLELEDSYYFRIQVGVPVVQYKWAEIDLLAGVQATHTELRLFTDESGGGGNAEVFEEDKYRVAPVVGVQAGFWFPEYENIYYYGGYNAIYQPSIAVQGQSSLNFNYNARADSGWQNEFWAGIQYRFN